MADKTITINARVKASLEGMDNVVKQLNDKLKNNKIELSDTSVLSKSLKEYNSAREELDRIFSKGFINPDEVKNVDKLSKKIKSLYEEIETSIKSMKGKEVIDLKKMFPANFSTKAKNGLKEISDYLDAVSKKEIKAQGLNNLNNELSQLETQLKKINGKRIKIEVESDIDLSKRKIEDLEEKKQQIRQSIVERESKEEVLKSGKTRTEHLAGRRLSATNKYNKTVEQKKALEGQESRQLTDAEKNEIDQIKKRATTRVNELEQRKAQLKEEQRKILNEIGKREGDQSKRRSSYRKDLSKEGLSDRSVQIAEELRQVEKKITKEKETQKSQVEKVQDRPKEELKQAKKQAEVEVERTKKAKERAEAVEKEHWQKRKQDIERAEKIADNFVSGRSTSGGTESEIADIEAINEALTEQINLQKQLNEEKKEAFKSSEEKEEQSQKTQLQIDKKKLDKTKFELDLENLKESADIDELWNKLGDTIDLSGFEKTEEGIKQLKQALKELDSEPAKKILSAFDEVEQKVENVKDDVKKLGDGLEEINWEDNAIKAQQRDIENLQESILHFFSIGNTIEIFKRSIKDAFNTIKELDAVMTETAVVTDFTVGDMWEKLPEYAEQASKLGSSIKDLYGATTLYYQQGLNSDAAMNVGIETMKMARIANMEASDATQAMTAALRGFNMEINEQSATRINDVYSELAAITAADTNQIATAMTKTASIADAANMEFETTAALLAQIIETTQEAPETAGTAMKTIIARFTEVKELFSEGMISGSDEEGEEININKIDAALKTVGISLKDFLSGAKGIDDIFLELASKWNTLDLATQRYIATTAAGSRQQSRFIAMMSNYERTMELVSAANSSAGASQKQYEKTQDSMEAKLQKLSNAWDVFVMGLANSDVVKFGVDALTKLLEIVNKLIDGFSGESGLAKAVISFMTGLGALKIGKGTINGISKFLFGSEWIKGDFKTDAFQMPFEALTRSISKKEGGLAFNLSSFLSAGGADEGAFLGLTTDITGLTTAATGAGIAMNLLGQGVQAIGWEAGGKLISDFGGALTAVGGVATTIAPLLAKLGLTAGPVGWIITALSALMVIIPRISQAIHEATPEGRLEAAQEATQKASEAAEDAAEAYENLKGALDSIGDQQNNLNNLVEGTDAWREAVHELNKEILSLVEKYPQLSDFVTYGKNGVLGLDYNARNEEGKTVQTILNDAEKNTTAANVAKTLAQAAESKEERELNTSNAIKQFQKDYGFKVSWNSNVVGGRRTEALREMAEEIARGEAIQGAAGLSDEEFRQEANKYLYRRMAQRKDIPVQADSLTKDFYFALNEIGQDLISPDQKSNFSYQQAVIQAMEMADLSGKSGELVRNIDSDIATSALEAYVENAKGEFETLTDSHKQEYAASRGWTYSGGKYYNANSQKVEEEIDDEMVKDFMANRKGANDYANYLERLSTAFSNNPQGEVLGQLLSQEGEKISYDLLKNYDGENLSSIIQDSSLNTMASALGMADEDGKATQNFKDFITQNLNFAQKRIDKQRVKNAARTAKYNKQQLSDLEHYKESALIAEEQDFEKYTAFLDSLDNIGDDSLASAAFEQFKINSSSMAELTKFNEDINWNNPIEAAKALRTEAEKGSGATQEYAKSLLEIQNSSIDASAQMEYFWNTASGEDFQKDLSEIIKTQGELTGSDVLDLAEDYSALNDMMENTGITAEGMAQALEMAAEDNASIDQLTNSVLAYLSSIDGLDHVIHKTLKGISDFDPGLDENQVSDFMTQANETLSGNIKKGAYGNSQNKKYLDFLLGPDWDNNLSGKEYEQRLKYAADQIGKNTSNMQNSWQNLVDGKDFWGNNLTKNEEGRYEELEGLGITRDSQGIKLTGYEGKTTDEIVSTLANAYGVSEQYARMMLTDFSNYSTELMQELASNDYTAGIEKVKESLAEIDSIGGKTKKTIDMSEIEKIAELSGKKIDEIIKDLGLDYSDITNFYNEDGSLKGAEDIESELNRVFGNQFSVGQAEQYGGQWIDSFTKNVNGMEIIDYDGMMQALSQLNLPPEAREQIAATVLSGAVEGSQEGYVKLTNQFGEPVEVPLTPNMSPEEIQGAINKAYTQAEADIFVQSFVNALAGAPNLQINTEEASGQVKDFKEQVESDPIEMSAVVKFEEGSNDPNNPNNPNNTPVNQPTRTPTYTSTTTTSTTNIALNQSSIGSLTSQIQASLDANPPTISPVLSADNTIGSDITAAIEAADRNVHVTATGIGEITSAINGAIPSSKKIGVSVTLEQSTIEFSGSATGIINISAYADGIKDSNLARHPALVGEEGPELIQTKDGAYLAGLNGPEMTEINRGDTVYTADETEKILKGGEHPSFPRFEKGIHGYGAVAAVKTGGNSGGAQGKLEDWENPFDRLYNLVREIDEELRERERIERRYEKLLNDLNVNADEIVKINDKELKQLQKEGNLQKQLIEGRKAQINNYQNENQDLQQYAKVERNELGEMVLRIDWEAINALEGSSDMSEEDKKQRDEKVARIEAYVSQLEEWFDSMTGAEEALWEIEDTIQEIKERGKEEYKNLEERIKEALIASYQNQIDDMEDRFDLINEANQDLLDSIQKSIDKTRQERENQEVEEDLAEKRRRLAYLQQDTSNANQMEILRLQDEIKQGSQDYTDSLIDQKISALQEQNEKAEKQRQQQVDLAQSQLDELIRSGGIWNKVYELMSSGITPEGTIKPNTDLENILKDADDFEGMSIVEQQQWTKDTNKQVASGMSWIKTGHQLDDIGVEKGSEITFEDPWGNTRTGIVTDNGDVYGTFAKGDGSTGYGTWDVYQNYDGKYYSKEGVHEITPTTLDLLEGEWIDFTDHWNKVRTGRVQSDGTVIAQAYEDPLRGMGIWKHVQMDSNGNFFTTETGVEWKSRDEIIRMRDLGLIKYKTGGLADFTGPAWLDGTKSRPEIVLNQQDSQNFIQLRDILSSVLNRGSISNTTTENSRDITYDIDINVEKVEDDYSVEQIANKVKSLITENARYRNDNVVSLRR